MNASPAARSAGTKTASLKPVKTVREVPIPYSSEERRVDKWVLMDETGVGQHIGWRKMGRQSAEMLVEALEARRLLSGVTLITHGYEPISRARPSWLDEMKNAIIDATGADTAVYALRVNRVFHDGNVAAFNGSGGAAIEASFFGFPIRSDIAVMVT